MFVLGEPIHNAERRLIPRDLHRILMDSAALLGTRVYAATTSGIDGNNIQALPTLEVVRTPMSTRLFGMMATLPCTVAESGTTAV